MHIEIQIPSLELGHNTREVVQLAKIFDFDTRGRFFLRDSFSTTSFLIMIISPTYTGRTATVPLSECLIKNV